MAVFRQMLKSKIHGAVITGTKLYYNGSIGIDKTLLAAADMMKGEKVQVLNLNNGASFETYIIEEDNSGAVVLYGPAARCGEVNDKIIIISYSYVSGEDIIKLKPKTVLVDDKNKTVGVK